MRVKLKAAQAVVAASTILLLVVFGIFAFLVWRGYQTTVSLAEAKAQMGADVLAEETRATLSSTLVLLNHLALELGALPSDEMVRSFGASISTLPQDFDVALYDTAGKLMTSSDRSDAPVDIAAQDYFSTLAAGNAWSLSKQAFAPENQTNKFFLASPIRHGSKFTGALVLSLDGSLIEHIRAPLDLGPESAVSLVREDGWLVARFPPLNKPLDLGPLPVFQTLTSAPQGTYFSPSSPADGVARVVGFRHLEGLKLIAIASISQDAAMAGLWTSVWTVLFLMGPIAIALLVGSTWTANLLRRSEADRNKLSTALTQNETLFREIHHRVKNNLQSVGALMQMQPIAREVKIEMGRRIAAMSAVHEQIYRSNDFATVRLKPYLHKLIAEAQEGSGTNAVVTEDIDDLAVDKDHATPLGLLVNEVISNAFKHAFSDGRAGELAVSLKITPDAKGELIIHDNGMGFDPDAPTSGIGRKLIAAFSKQVGGAAEFSFDGGSKFRLLFPLAGTLPKSA